VAEEGLPADAIPYRIPDLEPPGEGEDRSAANLFAAPPQGEGVQIWLALIPGRQLLELDAEARERLKALGYVGN
jgi:hypothetical protein